MSLRPRHLLLVAVVCAALLAVERYRHPLLPPPPPEVAQWQADNQSCLAIAAMRPPPERYLIRQRETGLPVYVSCMMEVGQSTMPPPEMRTEGRQWR